MRVYTRRDFLSIAGGAAVAAVAASCGGDDNGEDGASPTGGPTIAAPSPAVTAGTDAGAAGLRWYGQSMFLLTSPGGTTVLLDPFGDIGYTLPPPLDTDLATITHEHPDHNNDALGGTAKVLRGLTADSWTTIDETSGDVRVRTVGAYHDDQQGGLFGRNALFVLETGGLRFAHLGDLGHTLDDAQLGEVGPVDVLMVPVGGAFTIDAAEATEVAAQTQAKLVFPMHYATARTSVPIATADAFLEGKTVQRVGSTTLRISKAELPAEQTVMVLDYE
jgi:L-ascorbate metabolism protein UlaG (beta-lactamase superfamily)